MRLGPGSVAMGFMGLDLGFGSCSWLWPRGRAVLPGGRGKLGFSMINPCSSSHQSDCTTRGRPHVSALRRFGVWYGV